MAFSPNTVIDGIRSFPGGMNAGADPADLPPEQLAILVNGTIRGSFVSDRPPFQQLAISGDFDGSGLFQGACYFKPDNGPELIVSQIGGKIYTFNPGYLTATSAYYAISGGNNPADATNGPFQAYLWQAERWVIINDGVSSPVLFDGLEAKRNISSAPIATVSGSVGSLVVGSTYTINFTAPYSGPQNVALLIKNPSGQWVGSFKINQTITPGTTNSTLQGGPATLPKDTLLATRTQATNYSASVTAAASTDNGSTPVYAWQGTASGFSGGATIVPQASSDLTGSHLTIGGVDRGAITSMNDYLSHAYLVGVDLSGVSGPAYVQTGTTPNPAKTSLTLQLSKSWSGAGHLYVTGVGAGSSGLSVNQSFTVKSYSGTTVTIATGSGVWTGTIGAGTTVSDSTSTSYNYTTIATVNQAVSVVAGSATAADLSPAYQSAAIQVYALNPDMTLILPGTLTLASKSTTPTSSLSVTVVTLNTGQTSIPDQSQVYQGTSIPIGKQGAYIRGRNYIALPDGASFIVSDPVGGSMGSSAYQYRDAVLQFQQSASLLGGLIRVPSNAGKIAWIVPGNTLDASLGQGPAQVGCENGVFSCNLPDDYSKWQTTDQPVLSQSVIDDGGVGPWAVVSANSDLIYRSIDGQMRSVSLSRRDFSNWGQVPCSSEVRGVLAADPKDLLPWCSGLKFDNRSLMTTGLVHGSQGTYGTKLAVINFDPLSGLRGKQPSVYDGIWTGLNILQLVAGTFGGVKRCFAFYYDTQGQSIGLAELLPSPSKPQAGKLGPYDCNDWLIQSYNNTAQITSVLPRTLNTGDVIQSAQAGAWLAIVSSPSQSVTGSSVPGIIGSVTARQSDNSGIIGLATGVEIGWQPASQATSYNIYRSTDATTLTDTAVLTPLATVAPGAYLDTAVVSGTRYFYRVAGINDHGEGPRSVLVGATYYDTLPASNGSTATTAPNITQMAAVVNGSHLYVYVSAMWNENAPANYTASLWRSLTGEAGTFTLIQSLSTDYVASGWNVLVDEPPLTTPPTTYYYLVVGRNKNTHALQSSGAKMALTAKVPTAFTNTLPTYTLEALHFTAIPGQLYVLSPVGETRGIISVTSTALIADNSVWKKSSLTLSVQDGGSFTIGQEDILALMLPTWTSSGVVKAGVGIASLPATVQLQDQWTLGDSVVLIGTKPAIISGAGRTATNQLFPIKQRFETGPVLRQAGPAIRGGMIKLPREMVRLIDGEIHLQDIQSDVQVAVYFRPNSSWLWKLWRSWTITYDPYPTGSSGRASYQIPLGLGEPPHDCDKSTNRPWREAFWFHIAVEITGHCTFLEGLFYGNVLQTGLAPLNPITQPTRLMPVPNPPSPVEPTEVSGLTGAGGEVIIGAGGGTITPAE